MQTIERKLPREGKGVAIVADSTLRRFNMVEYSYDWSELDKPIDFNKAHFYFPIMVDETTVREVFQYR